MNKRHYLILIVISISITSSMIPASAAVLTPNADNIVNVLSTMRNPFKPQIPDPLPPPVKKEAQQPLEETRESRRQKQQLERQQQETARQQAEEQRRAAQTIQTIRQQAEIPPPTLTISGLIWNSDRPQAIINGHVVSVGDLVEQIEIVSIKKTGVDIRFHGKVITITP